MTSTFDSSEQSNHVDDHDNNIIPSSSIVSSDVVISEEKNEEPVTNSESEQTDITTDNTIDEISETNKTQSTNMINAEASFTEATSADLPLGTPRSSIARILVKPGQIFRVQVDNEVKEVHGK
ncbi:unnamed protein product [Rotaria sp. Silwood2]|nr:unnamed protein product [Rotaria sp. Silwood2]CAF2626626.1 unnamed protein product [Rotaria sp. Silwood2]CAF2851351.1 unnamed protein product [Rotaria sp. Silwood2]CAF2997741.1 unnamed protein product [Rotaria sp. Silwood2]CAF3963741.1 unnamed protein product [Rotaria sp. Silwood2]